MDHLSDDELNEFLAEESATDLLKESMQKWKDEAKGERQSGFSKKMLNAQAYSFLLELLGDVGNNLFLTKDQEVKVSLFVTTAVKPTKTQEGGKPIEGKDLVYFIDTRDIMMVATYLIQLANFYLLSLDKQKAPSTSLPSGVREQVSDIIGGTDQK